MVNRTPEVVIWFVLFLFLLFFYLILAVSRIDLEGFFHRAHPPKVK